MFRSVSALFMTVLISPIGGIATAEGLKSDNFNPLVESADSTDWDPVSPWKLPQGYHQWVVADE
ncbi:MAG: hypothetical protein JAZ05_04875, partial [Candidatus Thiodiazotropha taylori]|nr:hypothetical protein [Candidatus Thiodiazotropha taylori]MCW4291347.1 hypothetical protein [Candidatus Thiodiazotropha taylori]